MRNSALACAALGAALTLTVATPAHAHLMPPQQATLNIRDSAAFAVFSIPVSALRAWDDDRNGRMSPAEFTRHHEAIAAQLDAGIRITSGGDAGARVLLMPSLDLDPVSAPQVTEASHLLVLVRQSFTQVPRQLALRLGLRGTGAEEREFLVKATVNGQQPEVAIVRDPARTYAFFAPASVPGLSGSWAMVRWWQAGVAGCLLLVAAILLPPVRSPAPRHRRARPLPPRGDARA